MSGYVGSKLIIVEGLTGSGKSIMAHFIARQLGYNHIPVFWVHEGEDPHPIMVDVETSIEDYMAVMLGRWSAYVERIGSSNEVCVVEACFFNNLIETLLIQNLPRAKIIQYADRLVEIIVPLNPTLVYLVQADLEKALERNFKNRGAGFQEFVIKLTTDTPLARERGWVGYDGMVKFWDEFVSLTDELFHRSGMRKLMIDNSAGNWEQSNQQVLTCLSIPRVAEQGLSLEDAQRFQGTYKDRLSGKEFVVCHQDGDLTINLFLDVQTHLVGRSGDTFQAEGWHFLISFEGDDVGRAQLMRIAGRDVDYLKLVGTIAERVSE